ncbi:plasmid recombination protein [Sphingomonas sediminicola]|uniref:Plasmid recombination protein n=1 Tax=Sphingomonas sediminicola TaxID=386874 RepID=A0ABX6T819_9SPHN|nr:plasmid recombination protein [Sphingomonas sediminicola]
MGSFNRKRVNDEDEILPIGRRKLRPEPKPERKGYVGRFPAQADGRPALGFATLSHNNLKTWTQVARAQGHNTRKIEAPNARKDAPEPIELLASATGSYVDRVKGVLQDHKVATKVRRNAGAIASEDVYSASPEYWNRAGDWKSKPTSEILADPVVQAALALARKKHGKRLISVTLHLDEESPHVHVVAVPLVQREHAVRGRLPKHCARDEAGKPIDVRPKVLKWSLDPSSIRGRSKQLEANHDEWAAACEKLGLVRGSRVRR